jgi:hypothetical protein
MIDTTSEKDLWLALFNSETKEELEQLMKRGGEVMTQAVGAYHSITADKQFQYLEWLRTKTGHDEAQAISNAERKRDKHWQGVIAEKDTALAEKDTALAEQAKLIAELQAQLKK